VIAAGFGEKEEREEIQEPFGKTIDFESFKQERPSINKRERREGFVASGEKPFDIGKDFYQIPTFMRTKAD
jgi:hypothetical protein